MAIERKDPMSGKYVLFRSALEHSRACELHPYDRIPRRVFLDTNVVNTLVRHAENIFKRIPADMSWEAVLAEDVEALMHIAACGGSAPWTLVSSSAMLAELSNTQAEATRDALLDYGIELVEWLADDETAFRDDFSRRVESSGLLGAMPDIADRRLLSHAIALQCDAFCTRDRATIVSRRSLLPTLPTRIVTPREWWEAIRPWCGLFA